MKVKILILTGYGINAEKELAWAFELAGGETNIVHLEDLISNAAMLKDYQILAFPGGFSFGDHIASGKIFGNKIKYTIFSELIRFIESDNLIIGICNGFQIITKLGLVPNAADKFEQTASLIGNDSGHFENRWVWVKNLNKNSIWLKDIDKLYLPVRHGEGKFIVKNDNILKDIQNNGQIALQYFNPDSDKAEYPFNPNGSVLDIAGITNKKGNVFGLMPHPEAYIFLQNNPNWSENIDNSGFTGLKIFQNGVDYFKK
ncbi:MAG TPA: phosphoribosylformylglycinamidine synthase I [Spirochaetota bacterium]|nr:MAG: Phosphoribosylformylglycinamidine synthase 1 [Spirochaetes bacterium ADurb.Bin133]HNZ26261.1 phosphoribosylformylglycinamidine synthase I [Spirochaetota bacterium]HPY88039.1 phosphoribosylformylglycinamidine synthase I [Spirochaetota bacterium]